MKGMGKTGGGSNGGGMMGGKGVMPGAMPMDKKPMMPEMHSQNDMSKHSSPEMAKCQKSTAAEMSKMVGYGKK